MAAHASESGIMPGAVQTGLLAIEPATAEWIATSPDQRWAAFLAYWHGLADRLGRVPSRRDLDPVELSAALLPNIFLIDIVAADDSSGQPRFRFRLLGGEIMTREKVRSGTYLDELGTAEDLTAIERHYHDAIRGQIRLRDATLVWEASTKDHVGYKVILLPLAGDDGSVAHLIGCAIYENEGRAG